MNAVANCERPSRGPDLDAGAPLDQHIAWLNAVIDDPEGYAMLFVTAIEAAGLVEAVVDDRGEHIRFGMVADERLKERSTWVNELRAHLDCAGHHDALRRLLFAREKVLDGRTRNIAGVIGAIRNYLTTGGAILVTPSGKLRERVSFHPSSLQTQEAFAAAGRASRAYHLARRWPGAERRIVRAARLAGKPTDNGWLVLEAGA